MHATAITAGRARHAYACITHACLPQNGNVLTLCSPVTAIAMLEGFVKLEKGDVVVQNGGTSAVAQVRSWQAGAVACCLEQSCALVKEQASLQILLLGQVLKCEGCCFCC